MSDNTSAVVLSCPSPDCVGYTWGPKERGKRSCPSCYAYVVVTKAGVKLIAPAIKRAQSGRVNLAERRLFTVVSGGTTPGGLPEGQILCSCCGERTDTLHSIDGKINATELGPVQKPNGFRLETDPLLLRPIFEKRYIPRNVRGIICNACVVRYGATPVDAMGKRDKRKVLMIPITESFPTWNNPAQREATDRLERYMVACRLNDQTPLLATIHAISAKATTAKGDQIESSAGWAHVRLIQQGSRFQLVGSNWMSAETIHPNHCACPNCKLRGEGPMVRWAGSPLSRFPALPSELLGTTAYSAMGGLAPVLCRAHRGIPLYAFPEGPIPRVVTPSSIGTFDRRVVVQRSLSARMRGIGTVARAIADGMRPKRIAASLPFVSTVSLASLRASIGRKRTCYDPPVRVHFGSRPLPRRAIRLQPVP